MSWVKQKDDEIIPKWLKDNIPESCRCGGNMMNYYNPRGDITGRKCDNPKCPYMMAEKVASMCDLLGIKGFGSKTALARIKSNNLTTHFQCLPFITQNKPNVSMFTYMRMCLIEGIDTGWKKAIGDFKNMESFLSEYKGDLREIINDNIDLIRDGLNYVTVQEGWRPKYKAVVSGNVMLSGSFKNFQDKNDLIKAINLITEGAARFDIVGKRKTNVYALITEPDEKKHAKYFTAKEEGIPIMSPDEFQIHIAEIISKNKPLQLEEY